MEDFFKAISNYGFPIVLSGYLLLRFEGKLESLTIQITNLKDTIINLNDKLDKK